MDLMFKQIKGKLELDDEQVQNSKIMGMRNLWVKQISCVINRTASRNIMAGRAALVEAVNASSKDDRTSTLWSVYRETLSQCFASLTCN